MTFIISVTIVMYLLVIAWSFVNLEDTEKIKKVIIIIIGLVAVFLITQILYSISKNNVVYESPNIENAVRKTIVFLFTGLNGFIMSIIIKLFKKQQNGEIDNNVFKVRLITICIIFLILLFLECGYMTSTQEGILKVYKSNI